jgi:hypothetical protein
MKFAVGLNVRPWPVPTGGTAARAPPTDTCVRPVRGRARLAVSGRFPRLTETLCFSFPRRWPTGAAMHESATAERPKFLFGASASTAERDASCLVGSSHYCCALAPFATWVNVPV